MPTYQGDPYQIDEFTADLSAATSPVSLIPLADGRVWLLGPEDSSIIDYDILHVTGGAGKDLLIGGEGDDYLEGGAGNDIIDGGWHDGNDVLVIPNADDDTLIGGTGTDILSYGYADAGVTVSLAEQGTRIDTKGAGNDYIEGFENLTGSKYDDVLTGDAANNVIEGGRGNDVINGGGGTDTATYASLANQFGEGVTVTLAIASQQETGAAGSDTLIGIENLTGSNYADVLSGNGDVNVIAGLAGDDYLSGGLGNDTLDGGAGYDTAAFTDAISAVTVSLVTGDVTGGAGQDRLLSIENVVGSNFNDTIIGNTLSNTIDGGAGADTMTGGDGDDTYYVDNGGDHIIELNGQGYDTVITAVSTVLGANVEAMILVASNLTGVGNNQDNLIIVSDVDETIDGAGGNDTVSFNSSNGSITASLATVGGQNTGGAGQTSLINIENLTGSFYDDSLTGDTGANVLSGWYGSDILEGGGGNDLLDGGADFDWVSYAHASQAVTISLADAVHATATEGTDTFVSIEGLIGSAFDDVLTGDAGSNLLDGGGGNDTLDGGFGIDGADYSRAAAAVAVSLLTQTAQNTGGAGVDTLISIDDLIGSRFNDTLIGNESANVLDGGAGGDILRGYGGDDTYVVDSASDVVIELDGEGYDTVVSSLNYALGSDVEALYLTGAAQVGTGNGLDNVIVGTSGDNTLVGNGGNDNLIGGFGQDTMIGGTGDDTYQVDNQNDIVTEQANEGFDWVETSLNNYTLADQVEGLRALFNGTGNAANNQIFGSDYNNVLNGGAGADTMDGGYGSDTYYVDDLGDVVVDSGGYGYDTVFASVTYAAGTGVESIRLLTGSGNINAIGNALGNDLYGNEGNNRLDGAAGADIMSGGTGDDTYVVDQAGDVAGELVDAGNDTVEASISYSLAGQYIETLKLTGSDNINATGNNQSNTLIGNSGNNQLNGGRGVDSMAGGAGDDTYYVDEATDTVTEEANAGYDIVRVSAQTAYVLGSNIEAGVLTGANGSSLTGNSLDNLLIGDVSNNKLDGDLGADIMFGDDGDDIYIVNNVGDVVLENDNGGTDLVRSSVRYDLSGQFVENLTLTGTGNIDAGGNGLQNVLIGNSGNNILDGKGGADVLAGGLGDDTYYIDNVGDKVTELEGQGTDTIISSVSTGLVGTFVEHLTLLGNQNLNGAGNSLNNTIKGNAGNNVIDGGAGSDTMLGGAGNDTYFVDNAGDKVTEFANEGTDMVISSVGFTLAGSHVENLTLTGSANINATGNGLANTLNGNLGANLIDGGLGADTLTGETGADSFRFTTALGSGNVDTITDFSVVDDTIQLDDAIFSAAGALGTLTSGAFWTGSAAHDADDRIVYDTTTGALYYDADGNGAGAAVQFATIGTGLALTNADFVLI